MWSSIPNRCRSSLQQHSNFTVLEDVQYLDGTISNNVVLILSQTSCVYATVDGVNHSRSALCSKRCRIKKYNILNLKKARHIKQHLQIAAESPSLHRKPKGFDFVVTEMMVSFTFRLLRQRFTFGSGSIYTVFHYVLS